MSHWCSLLGNPFSKHPSVVSELMINLGDRFRRVSISKVFLVEGQQVYPVEIKTHFLEVLGCMWCQSLLYVS